MHSIKSYINYASLYAIFLTVYHFHESLHIVNPWIIRILYVIIGIVSVYCAIKVLSKERKNPFFISVNLLLVYIFIHGIVYYLSDVTHYNYITGNYINKIQFTTDVFYGFLPIYAFYYFSQNNKINEGWISFYLIFYLLLSVGEYTYNALNYFAEYIYRDSMTNNTSYEFVSLFPLLVFFRKYTIPQMLLLGCMLFYMVSGAKRGAIIIGIICLVYFFYSSYKDTPKSKYLYVFIILIAIFIGFNFFRDLILNDDYFLERIEATLSGDSSGRDKIYSKLWKHYINTGLPFQIFGSGAYSTIQVAGNLAHQDWLELAIDCGIIGCILYFMFFYSFKNTIVKIKSNVLKSSLYLSIIIMFLKSLYSMSYSSLSIPLAISIGYCLAMRDNKQYYE